MSTALTAEQDFQAKIQDRIRAAVGELMPDAVLSNIIAKGIEKAFFEKIDIADRWGSKTYEDPWFVRFIRTEMEKAVREAIDKWLNDNRDKVQAAMQQVVDEGVTACVVRTLNSIALEPLRQLEHRFNEAANRLQGH